MSNLVAFWMTGSGDPRDVPGVDEVWAAVDACLARRWAGFRITLYCRDSWTGVDHAVRRYAKARGLGCLPVGPQPDVYGEMAAFRRDVELVARACGVLWFGDRDGDGDPARLAELLGIPYRVITPPRRTS